MLSYFLLLLLQIQCCSYTLDFNEPSALRQRYVGLLIIIVGDKADPIRLEGVRFYVHVV